MDIVAEELPYAAVVKDELLESVCSACFKESAQLQLQGKRLSRCARCKVVSYCSKQCQKKDWTEHHKPECTALLRISSKFIPHVEARFIARIAWRRARGDEGLAYNDRQFSHLMNHKPEIENNPGRMSYFEDLSLLLVDYMGSDCPSRDVLFDYFGKVAINAYSIGTLGRGLYIGISIHDHSCVPDMKIDFDGVRMSLCTLKERGLKYSKDLFVSYLDVKPLKTMEERQEELKRYYFRCACPRCLDEERDRIVLSIRCTNCTKGVCPFDKNFETLSCKTCGKVSPISVDEAIKYNEEAAQWHKQNDNAMNFKDIKGCRRFLTECLAVYNKCSPVLSHLNLHLAQLARDICMLTVTSGNPDVATKFATVGLEAYDYHFMKWDIEVTARYQAATLCLELSSPASLEAIKMCRKTRDLAILSHGADSSLVGSIDQKLSLLMLMHELNKH